MKLKSCYALLAAGGLFSAMSTQAEELTTAIAYNGVLNRDGRPETGAFDFEFTLYSSPSGGGPVAGPLSIEDLAVNNGVFTTHLNFGDVFFDGQRRWLQIAVRPGEGSGEFATLTPRHELAAAPFAHYAKTAQIAASVAPGSVNASSIGADAVTSESIATGAIQPSDLSPDLMVNTWWGVNGNFGTGNGNFLGTIDRQPLELRANSRRVLRLEAFGDPTPPFTYHGVANVMAGSFANTIPPDVFGATISGGGAAFHPVSGAASNSARADFATVAGGLQNTSSGYYAVVSGGAENVSSGWASTIAGGTENRCSGERSTVGGGQYNSSTGYSSVVAGGGGNTSSGQYSIVPGGQNNSAEADYAFAAGRSAKARHTGSFIWADNSHYVDFESNIPNKVRFRCTGGFDIISGIDVSGNQTAGVYLTPGGGSWTTISDRNAKENVQAIDAREVLEKVVRLPVSTWNYKSQERSIRHIGPMAQDFKAAFAVGETETGIATVDADGIALAAIQGLNQKVEAFRSEIRARDEKIVALEESISRLRMLVDQFITKDPQ